MVYLAIMLITLTLSANAQEKYQIEHINMEKGLSWTFVTAICQDEEGYIWIGTAQGLNRYDGYDIPTYWHDKFDASSISNSRIEALCLDKDGYLWIGTKDRGLNKFDKYNNRFERYVHDPADTCSLIGNTVRALVCDYDNNLWIGTARGLNRYSVQNNTFYRFTHDSSNIHSLSGDRISCLFLDSINNLWIGTDLSGLNKLNIETEKIIRFVHDPENPNTISSNEIESIYEDKEGNIWIRTRDRLDKYLSGDRFIHYGGKKHFPVVNTHGFIASIVEGDDGHLWLGSKDVGLLRFNKHTSAFTNFSKSLPLSMNFDTDQLSTLFKDRSGVLWIGTGTQGIITLSAAKTRFHVLKVPQTNRTHWANYVLTACPDNSSDDTIWIGTLGSGLIKYNLTTNEYESFNFSSRNIEQNEGYVFRSIFNIGSNHLLISGMQNGLFKFDKDKKTVTSIDNTKLPGLHTMVKDPLHDNIFWIGADNGIHKFDLSTEKLSPCYLNSMIPEKNIKVFCITIEENNGRRTLWAGTNQNGLFKIDLETNTIEQFIKGDENYSLSDNTVQTIFIDEIGFLWIGTKNGLDRLNTDTGLLESYTTENGLPHNSICGLIRDNKSYMWISTRQGISKFDPDKVTFENYFEKDGIHGNFFMLRSQALLHDGRLFFGGNYGFTVIDPEANNTNIPSVVLKSFKVHNQIVYDSYDLSRIEKVELPYKSNFFTIEFAALDFHQPERNQFYYILEKFEKDWHHSYSNNAEYRNVNPGKYTFIVKGSNNDGIWNEAGNSITIVILPPWWMTWWFRILSGLLLVSLIFYFFNKRLKYHRSERMKQETFSQRLIESQENERKRIAAELHDSLGQNLLLVNNEIQKLLSKCKEGKKEIEEAAGLVKESLNEVRAISLSLHPHQLDKLGLKKAIEASIQKISHSTNIKFIKRIEEIEGLLPKEKEIHYYRILQEVINNIIKHSEADTVTIEIYNKNSVLVSAIMDNGIGFNVKNLQMKDSADSGLGLHFMDERAKILGSTINIKSDPRIGTAIKISIPIK